MTKITKQTSARRRLRQVVMIIGGLLVAKFPETASAHPRKSLKVAIDHSTDNRRSHLADLCSNYFRVLLQRKQSRSVGSRTAGVTFGRVDQGREHDFIHTSFFGSLGGSRIAFISGNSRAAHEYQGEIRPSSGVSLGQLPPMGNLKLFNPAGEIVADRLLPFVTGISISPDESKVALQILRRNGGTVFGKLYYFAGAYALEGLLGPIFNRVLVIDRELFMSKIRQPRPDSNIWEPEKVFAGDSIVKLDIPNSLSHTFSWFAGPAKHGFLVAELAEPTGRHGIRYRFHSFQSDSSQPVFNEILPPTARPIFSENGTYALISVDEQTVEIFSVDKNAPDQRKPFPNLCSLQKIHLKMQSSTEKIRALHISPNGQWIVIAGSENLYLYHHRRDRFVRCDTSIEWTPFLNSSLLDPLGSPFSLALSNQFLFVASGVGGPGSLTLIDLNSLKAAWGTNRKHIITPTPFGAFGKEIEVSGRSADGSVAFVTYGPFTLEFDLKALR